MTEGKTQFSKAKKDCLLQPQNTIEDKSRSHVHAVHKNVDDIRD